MLDLAVTTARILVLLWGINLAPPLAAFALEDRWATPIDRGRRFSDGAALFGSHKTFRGLLAGLLTGPLLGALLLFPVWVGLVSGLLCMLGDVLTSFVKRRFKLAPGSELPALDHCLEGILPLGILSLHLQLSLGQTLLILLLFLLGGWYGSRLYRRVLFKAPFPAYPRRISPRTRVKELASCRQKPTLWSALVHFEEAVYYHLVLASCLRLCGLYERGRQNALAFRLNSYQASLPDLPDAFEGYRILFLSDLHLDGLTGLTERLIGLLGKAEADLCILGGDYRMSTYGSPKAGLPQLQRLLKTLKPSDGVVAVMGNHDCLEMIEELHSFGVRVLINEAETISRGDDRLYIVGVDDPHYYRCHDLQTAFAGVPEQAASILAAHSPALFEQARQHQASLYLTGHTHAGQIQLPWLGMVYKHCSAPKRLCQGPWEHGGMLGYTSAGVGVSGVPVRYNCQGEVVLFRLTRGQPGLHRLEPQAEA
jgi:hypothetical protein